MYYEHDIVIKMRVNSLTDEVKQKAIEETFKAGHWDFEVESTQLATPVEVVARIKDQIRLHGLTSFKHCDGNHVDLVNEVLDRVIDDLEDFQSTYEEAL